MPAQAGIGSEQLRRRSIVDVFAGSKGFDERLFAGKVRKHSQLNLRVVGGDQHRSRSGNERATNLATELRADWNVLQVGFRAAQTSVAAIA